MSQQNIHHQILRGDTYKRGGRLAVWLQVSFPGPAARLSAPAPTPASNTQGSSFRMSSLTLVIFCFITCNSRFLTGVRCGRQRVAQVLGGAGLPSPGRGQESGARPPWSPPAPPPREGPPSLPAPAPRPCPAPRQALAPPWARRLAPELVRRECWGGRGSLVTGDGDRPPPVGIPSVSHPQD